MLVTVNADLLMDSNPADHPVDPVEKKETVPIFGRFFSRKFAGVPREL